MPCHSPKIVIWRLYVQGLCIVVGRGLRQLVRSLQQLWAQSEERPRISGDTGGRIEPQHFCFGRKAFKKKKKSRSFKGTRSSQAEEGLEGRMTPVVRQDPPLIRHPKLVPSYHGQAEPQEKVGVSGEPLLGQRRCYLHETSTPGHQDPLRKAAGRTQGLHKARSRHLPARRCLEP